LTRPDPARSIAVLKEVSDAGVLFVESLRVEGMQTLHPASEVRLMRPDEQVNVVPHEAVRKAVPHPFANDVPDQVEIAMAILVVFEDRPSIDTPGVNVMNSAGFFIAWLSWHDNERPRKQKLAPQQRGLTPFTPETFTCERGQTPLLF